MALNSILQLSVQSYLEGYIPTAVDFLYTVSFRIIAFNLVDRDTLIPVHCKDPAVVGIPYTVHYIATLVFVIYLCKLAKFL